jgi:TolA-binding protein
MLTALKPAAATPPPIPAAAIGAVLVLALCGAVHASPQEQYQAAAQAVEKGDFKAAKTAAEAIVKDGDVSPEVFTLLGHASYKQGQPGKRVYRPRTPRLPKAI